MATPPEDEWIELYRVTLRPLYAYAARRAGDRELAEDVTQESWLRAVEAWRRSGPPRDPLAWLQTVAANLLRNHFRRQRPQALGAAELALGPRELTATTPGAVALVQWGLARLPRRRARLVGAHHLDGRPLAELAAEEGTSERAIEGRLRRARHALQRILEPHIATQGGRP